MASFREQMQELAAKVARSRNERHQAVAEFPKFHDQLRRQVKRERDEVRRELETSARNQARELNSFNTQNQRNVARMLRETRSTRISRSQAARHRLQRELSKNRQDLIRSLQQNHAQRKRLQRSVSRQSLQAIQAVHTRVEALRSGTRRSIRALGADRMEGRRIWLNLRSLGRTKQSEGRGTIEPARRAVSPVLAVSELSGLALPPTRA